MLQRVVAVVLAVLGLTTVGLAVASGTIWKPDDIVAAHASPDEPATLLITQAGVLDLVDEAVTIKASRDDGGPLTLAIGRESDVLGWVGEDAHTVVTGLASWDSLSTTFIEGETVAVEPDADAGDADADADSTQEPAQSTGTGSGIVGPDPAGSDMWLVSESADGEASLTWDVPEGRFLLLVANSGDDAPPPEVTLVWEREVSSPLLVPGIVVGVVLILGAVVLFVVSRRGSADLTSRAAAGAQGLPVPVGLESPLNAHATPGTDPAPSTAIGHTGLGRPDAGTPDFAGPTSPIVSRAAVSEQPTAPMSRRELRELAEREAAERTRSRRSVRVKRRRTDDAASEDSVAGGGDELAGSSTSTRSSRSAMSTRSTRSIRSTRSTRSTKSIRSALSATTGTFPKVEPPSDPEPPKIDAQDRNRADAWRQAWGFQQSWEPDDGPGDEQAEREDQR